MNEADFQLIDSLVMQMNLANDDYIKKTEFIRQTLNKIPRKFGLEDFSEFEELFEMMVKTESFMGSW